MQCKYTLGTSPIRIIATPSLQREIELYGNNKLLSSLWEFSWFDQKGKENWVPSIYWKMKYRLISCIQKETLITKQNIAILEVFKWSHRSKRLQMTGYGRQSWDIMILGNNKNTFFISLETRRLFPFRRWEKTVMWKLFKTISPKSFQHQITRHFETVLLYLKN